MPLCCGFWCLLGSLIGGSRSTSLSLIGLHPLLPRGDMYKEGLGFVLPGIILALRAASEANSVDDFWHIAEGVDRSLVACKRFLVATPFRSGGAVWEVGLFVAVLRVSCIRSVREMRLMLLLPSTS